MGNGLFVRSQDELVNAGVETVDMKVDNEAQNGANEIHADFGLLNGMNKNIEQEGSQNISWQPAEEYETLVTDHAITNRLQIDYKLTIIDFLIKKLRNEGRE